MLVKEKLTVIKIGGNVIDDEFQLSEFLQAFSVLKGNFILVHGGGKLATEMAEQMGIPQQMVDGRRITDAASLKVVTMVYAGYISKNIVAGLQALQCNAIGLCGADANIILAHKRTNTTTDYGFAGDIDKVNTEAISKLLGYGLRLVVSPITHDNNGQLLNTNADTIASQLAVGLSDTFDVSLIYCFEKKGVLSDPKDDDSVIEKITPSNYEDFKSFGVISGGMIPKIDNALTAVGKGVSRVMIGNANQLADLILQKSGTTITDD